MTPWPWYRKAALAVFVIGSIAFVVAKVAGAQERFTGIVSRVIDGDSFVLRTDDLGDVKIRLWGVDAAEAGTAEGSAATSWAVDEWLGREVVCTQHGTSHGRVVARCFNTTPGPLSDIAWEGVHAGHLKDVPRFSRGYYGSNE